ncbi:hypothetical protein TraAM80_10347 [Trypanosoma rangeli]|uniref:Uncharacterized protein n=1 Tax=Trypanosoma rangeli TaxID=5698 RepID=A0A422MPS5_TRYRA|nr:uncharacterized protein TraAM80_10347 [Trypanosoma rangeli]RNE95197.1 hypothetical protein TraAM80_10347 [Trypanosoma rangeli]|eukprot:RNE95197.1 hypothetical protein TraAM80_10347 [Trypanosoma rangeli]
MSRSSVGAAISMGAFLHLLGYHAAKLPRQEQRRCRLPASGSEPPLSSMRRDSAVGIGLWYWGASPEPCFTPGPVRLKAVAAVAALSWSLLLPARGGGRAARHIPTSGRWRYVALPRQRVPPRAQA